MNADPATETRRKSKTPRPAASYRGAPRNAYMSARQRTRIARQRGLAADALERRAA